MQRQRANQRRVKRPRTNKIKARKASITANVTTADLQEQLGRALRERDEALEQQTATSEVLKVISSSPGKLEPVFETMLANAVRVCGANFGIMDRYDGEAYCNVAMHNVPPAFAEMRRSNPVIRPSPGTGLDRVQRTKKVVQILDLKSEQAYRDRAPARVALVELAGARTLLVVPMLKDDVLLGTIAIYRQEVRPFANKQIELLENFSAQAVIAIENTRLLNELRESLQQQTATADVLKVISSSPGELEPVFQAMLENATRICEAKFGVLHRCQDGAFEARAMVGVPPTLAHELQRRALFVSPKGAPLDRLLRTKKTIHTVDATKEQTQPPSVKLGGARSHIAVPLIKAGEVVGAFTIYRTEVRPFTDKQIELVENFAAQAVIAIENTQLLNELRQRTDDLTESLEQQTATSEILEVISNSPTNTQPVFDAIVRSGLMLFPDAVVAISLPDRDLVKLAAIGGADEAGLEALRGRYPMPLSHEFITGTAILDRREIDLADAQEPPKELTVGARNLLAGGYRAMTVMPMMRGDETIGALNVVRRHPGPLSDKQRELLRTFANQAVIAIENTRLFNELRESLQQQTATADVLKVISRSTFDLQTVLDTLLQSAANLCRADRAAIRLLRDGAYHTVAIHGFSPQHVEYMKNHATTVDRTSIAGRAVLEGKAVQIADVQSEPELTLLRAAPGLANVRTLLGVPMLREGTPIGVLVLSRERVHPFTDKQIELVSTFADQAVIAIENVRLFESVEARTRELAASLEDLRTTQDRLVQTQKLASLGQLTAGIAHEIKNPLNFVNNFSGISAELITELKESLADVSLNEKRRAEITELMDTLRGNLDKIVQHGKRADAIVKNMLLHSREGSGEHRLVDINALVEESLNLAYHGARAEKQGFNITLERSFDPAAGQADVFPQDITRVLLNLISNGFYAATKRKANAGEGYEPTLVASTRNKGDRVEIRVRDNGIGIPPEVKEKIFNPFFTTKPAGEGTGLGLSISHDVIVKQHGGSIEVETKPGAFSEFIIVLPRAGAPLTKSGEPS
jgi:two-component system, NtrC family, sensor kinase